MDRGMDQAQDHEYPGERDEQRAGMLGRQSERGHRIEQDRQFELVVERIGDLGDARRPVRLAQRDVAQFDYAGRGHPGAQQRHREQQREGQRRLDENRQQHVTDGHGFPFWLFSPVSSSAKAEDPVAIYASSQN